MNTIVLLALFSVFSACLAQNCGRPSNPGVVPASNPCIFYTGRTVTNTDGSVSFDWSGIEIYAAFEGTSVALILKGGAQNEYNVFVDGKPYPNIVVVAQNSTYTVASGLEDSVHSLLVTKRTEAFFGAQDFVGLKLDTGKWIQQENVAKNRKIEVIGDSITCGYGDEGKFPCSFSAPTENNLASYGPLIAAHFDAEYYLECWSGKGIVRNYGYPGPVSPDPFPSYYNLSLASNPNSPRWNFKYVPDLVIINLGTNDCSTQPIPPADVFQGGFKRFIAEIRGNYGNVPIFLICGPMLGQSPCCNYVEQIVAATPNSHYIGMVGLLNENDLGCDYHPSVVGHAKMAQKAIPIISQAMGW